MAAAPLAAHGVQKTAYMAFHNVDLGTFGETMVPAFEFEVSTSWWEKARMVLPGPLYDQMAADG